MSKGRGQSRNRSFNRGNIDIDGTSLKRPWNNRKRTKGRSDEIKKEKFYKYLLKRIKKLNESKSSKHI